MMLLAEEVMERRAYLEAFLPVLAGCLDEPSERLPSVRCVSRRTLYRIFNEVRASLRSRGVTRGILQREILEELQAMSIVRSIPVRNEAGSVDGIQYYEVGFPPSEKGDVDPKELLHAAFPEGVICYFTALGFHELTTQIPSHHHVARMREDEGGGTVPAESVHAGESRGEGRTYSRMGQFLFQYREQSYYWTSRSPELLQKFRIWRLNPKLMVRVVTLEQALVDTLHQPARCGGPAVIQEAWGEAIDEDRIDYAKLGDILRGAGRSNIVRRVGYMLTEMGVEAEGELGQVLQWAKRGIDRADTEAAVSLLPGYLCSEYNEQWHLMVLG